MKIQEVAYHRNGVSGEGFHVVTFKSDRRISQGATRKFPDMVAVVYEERGKVAVFDRDLLAAGVIAFGENSWRAEAFEPELRAAIKEYEDNL